MKNYLLGILTVLVISYGSTYVWNHTENPTIEKYSFYVNFHLVEGNWLTRMIDGD